MKNYEESVFFSTSSFAPFTSIGFSEGCLMPGSGFTTGLFLINFKNLSGIGLIGGKFGFNVVVFGDAAGVRGAVAEGFGTSTLVSARRDSGG